MEHQDYTVEDFNHGTLLKDSIAFYQEISITNHTTSDVVVINHNSEQSIIPRIIDPHSCGQYVMINVRSTVGVTRTRHADSIPLPGKIIRIKYENLKGKTVYVKELNYAFCLQENSMDVKHPYGCVSYADALISATEEIKELLPDCPNVTLTANDPKGRAEALYTALGKQIVTIPVTHIAAEDGAQLTFTLSTDGNTRYEKISLESLLAEKEDRDYIELETGIFQFLCRHKAQGQRLMERYQPMTNKKYAALEQELARTVQVLATENKKKLVEMEDEWSTRLKAKTLDVDLKDKKLKTAQADLEELHAKYNDLKARYTVEYDLNDRKRTHDETRHKDDKLREDAATSKIKHTEAKWKMWQVIIASIGTVLATLGVKAIVINLWDKYFDKDE